MEGTPVVAAPTARDAPRPGVPLLAVYCAVCALIFGTLYLGVGDMPSFALLDARARLTLFTLIFAGLGAGLGEFARWRFAVAADALLKTLGLPFLLLSALALAPCLLLLRAPRPGESREGLLVGVTLFAIALGPAIPAALWLVLRALLTPAPAVKRPPSLDHSEEGGE